MPLAKNDEITLEIQSLSSDGNGVARHDGWAVFVPGAAVGDVLRTKIVKVAKRHLFARIEEIITPGPGRIMPDCPVFGQCGGCDFRHISYESELLAKQGFVQDALQRLAHLDVPVLPIVPSPQTHRYRNKAQYPVAPQQGSTSWRYGFYARRSHRVVFCADCLLQPEQVNQITEAAAAALQELGATAYDEASHTGLVRHLYLRAAQKGDVLLCLVLSSVPKFSLDGFAQRLVQSFPQLTGVVLNINKERGNVICGPKSLVLWGSPVLADELCSVPLSLSPLSFSQVNAKGAEQLFAIAKEMAAPTDKDVLLDLYCGTGIIGLSMAGECAQLIGVEIVPEAVNSAKNSAAQMGLTNTRFLCADAAKAAAQLSAEGLRPSIVTLDPPRKGCDEATLRSVLAMAPQRIVMVSCNPATMARDTAFLAQNGYQPVKVQPVDMFPRTRHVETVVLMSRVDK